MRKLISLFLAAMLLALCACGKTTDNQAEVPLETESSPSDNSPAAEIIEPSLLISKEEAESILGVSLDRVQTSEQERVGLRQCIYESEDYFFQISLTQQAMMPAEQTQTPESLYRAIVENFEDAIKVDGVGDEAYFATPGLHILEDGYYILIAIGNLDDEGNSEKLVEAGKLAAWNLATVK